MGRHLAYKDKHWDPLPEAEGLITSTLDRALRACPAAARYADSLLESTGVRLRDIVDHVVLTDPRELQEAERLGWRSADGKVWRNPSGLLPPFLKGDRHEVWLRVEEVEQFLRANALPNDTEGKTYSPLRKAPVFFGDDIVFGVVERNGFPGFDVQETSDSIIRQARLHLQTFRSRRREFDSVEAGLAHTEKLVDAAVADIGPHWACDLWLKAEREFWMHRCSAGRIQKARQDSLGIGWSNVDHHTYDSSRAHFRRTVAILEKLGYELREMLYAGELAGWGSQVLWQPVIGSTIFADVDLAPEELTIDFAHEDLPPLRKHRRAGLISALIGESMLEPGLNHVAGLYDQRTFRAQFESLGFSMMAPFSDLPHLYQELTTGDWIAVDPVRVDALEAAGHIGSQEAEKLRLEGSIVAHLENIERNDGFAGFNREGIDGVLRKLDPRAYLASAT